MNPALSHVEIIALIREQRGIKCLKVRCLKLEDKKIIMSLQYFWQVLTLKSLLRSQDYIKFIFELFNTLTLDVSPLLIADGKYSDKKGLLQFITKLTL